MPQFVCPNCHATAQIQAAPPEPIIYGPENRHAVLCLEPFYTPCAMCGEQMLIMFPCAYTDADKGFTVRLTPPDFEPTKAPTEGCRILRDTDNVLSFREKIILFEAGYDDRAVEILKLFTEAANDAAFEHTMVMDANDVGLLLHAFGPNNVSITFASPRELYDRIRLELYDCPPDTEFTRVDQAWADSHTRVDKTTRNVQIHAQEPDQEK